ncbi:MAG: hypothetical protein JWM72_4192, partial [Actinomycetia bacterium]|nr:hypothetical protein [Actinomycetes bacterium]
RRVAGRNVTKPMVARTARLQSRARTHCPLGDAYARPKGPIPNCRLPRGVRRFAVGRALGAAHRASEHPCRNDRRRRVDERGRRPARRTYQDRQAPHHYGAAFPGADARRAHRPLPVARRLGVHGSRGRSCSSPQLPAPSLHARRRRGRVSGCALPRPAPHVRCATHCSGPSPRGGEDLPRALVDPRHDRSLRSPVPRSARSDR